MNFITRKLYRFKWYRRWAGIPEPSPAHAEIARITREMLGHLEECLSFTSSSSKREQDVPRVVVRVHRPELYKKES